MIALTIKDWTLLLIPTFVSIISIFISNFLGIKSTEIKHQLSVQEETYNKYHVPIIQWLNKHSVEDWNYAKLVAQSARLGDEHDFLITHITQNINYAPKSVITNFNKYIQKRHFIGYYDFESPMFNDPVAEKEIAVASDLFDKIIIDSLKQSTKLANKLGYPNIAEPMLESFLSEVDLYSEGKRYIPWTKHKDLR